jgi:hypothetical protein
MSEAKNVMRVLGGLKGTMRTTSLERIKKETLLQNLALFRYVSYTVTDCMLQA